MSGRPPTISSAKLALMAARARQQADGAVDSGSEPIAIIGIGCRFPGAVTSPDDYWRLVRGGRNAITEVPADRWNADALYSADPYAPGKMNTRWGGFLADVDLFDPAFFGISPREAVTIDPQQRLALEVAWEALWDAGITPGALAGSPTGVFVAIYNQDYARLLLGSPDTIGSHTCAGASHAMASGRISYLLDLRGPAVSVDTACSSSLVSVHLACQSIRTGDCRMALAGGVSLKLRPEHYLCLSHLAMLSPDGRCKTFDGGANGFVPGEGCGLVVLKRLADALADGDRIRAVIRGTAVNQDGRTTVLTAPNGLAQQSLIRAALANARVSPTDIGYVETHGTGTSLGDPIEVEALGAVMGDGHGTPCALGAVKTNIGHLEAAAGVAGLIKAALALEHEEIPPNLHFESLNPHISLEGTRLYVPTAVVPWSREAGRIRFAGVSSFGFTGTNAHIVLEEAPTLPSRRPKAAFGHEAPSVLTISARTPEALDALAERYRDYLETPAARELAIEDVCRAAALRRDHYEDRLAVVGTSHDELRSRLDDALAGRTMVGISRGHASIEPRRIGFLFSGQGSQWATMGCDLMKTEPVFRAVIDECDGLVRDLAGWSLVETLAAEEAGSRLGETAYAQVALFAVELALARLWASWGVVPHVVIGHSAGEVAAACTAGMLSLPEAVRMVVHRGRVMQAATGKGRMVAVSLAACDALHDIEPFEGRLSVAAINGPSSTVVSGDPEAVDAIIAAWQERRVAARLMPVDYAFHSAQMDALLPHLEAAFGSVLTQPGHTAMISTVSGQPIAASDLTAAYWAKGVRVPVQFRAAVEAAVVSGVDCFVEVGPHPVLSSALAECVAPRSVPALASLRRGRPERGSLLASIAALYASGHPLKWDAICGGKGPVVGLPAYPFQRDRCWVAADQLQHARSNDAERTPLTSFPLRRIESPAIRGRAWESVLDLDALPFLADHRINGSVVFPLSGFVELVLRAAQSSGYNLPISVEDLVIREPLELSDGSATVVHVGIADRRVDIHSRDRESWRHHVSARLSNDTISGGGGISVSAGAARTLRDVADFYRELGDRQLEYGPAFRCIRELSVADGSAESVVALPPDQTTAPSSWTLHPSLLDGCLQTMLAASDNDGSAYMPIALDALSVAGPADAALRCILTARPSVAGNNETLSADFVATTTEGASVVMCRGLHVKKIRPIDAEQSGRFSYNLQWVESKSQPPKAAPAGPLMLLDEVDGTAIGIAQALRSRGVECTVGSPEEACAGPRRYARVVFLAGTRSTPDTADGILAAQSSCRTLLALMQAEAAAGAANARELWVVTRNAQRALDDDTCAGFADATIWGLARTFALEHPEVRCVRVDVDESAASTDALVDALATGIDIEEVAFRAGRRLAPRLVRVGAPADESPLRLTITEHGSIDNLKYEPLLPREPGADDVEVEVHTSALNFRDVLNALGAYPGNAGALGLEFCGRITAVGNQVVNVAPGDRVMGIGWGSMADSVVTKAALVTTVPDALDSADAVTLPNAFATAYHCLIEVAGLRAGERVLIHAATGGVGSMAVQIARHVGAEVFATAGSPDKRRFLRDAGIEHVFDSRSLAFAQDIREATGGVGVDVVLNSLAGDFIGASMSVVAQGGRFVEIGKTGTWEAERVAALRRGIRYSVVDLALFVDGQPERIASHFDQLHRMLQSGAVVPLPKQVFRFDRAADAFRQMERARHIGKIVLQHQAARRFGPRGVWLLAGGLGAIGLRVADWLAERGATTLILLGRHAATAEAQARIEAIRRRGVRVQVRQIDLATVDDRTLDAIVAEVGNRIEGIGHLAGVIDDGVLMDQTWERFKHVFGPKVAGAWKLHEFASRHGVQHFLLFSSAAAVIGSPGQSGYAAANAFLDGLAAYRSALGAPAVAINWGVWADAGMAARTGVQGKRLALRMLRPMSPDGCLAAVPRILESGVAQAAVLSISGDLDDDVAGRRMATLLSADEASPRVRIAASQTAPSFVETLASVPPSRVRTFIVDHLRELARLVLGLSASHFIDEQQPLMKIGLDSLMALELRNKIAEAFGRPLNATLLFDCPTISALADFLHPPEGHKAITPSRDELFDAIASLSDDEAERLLEQELGARPGSER
jgi:acyl transferase domain-containing protein/acyl carrier protein